MRLAFHGEAAEVRRQFDAAPQLVFAAFADAALVRQWLKPHADVGLDVLAYDFRPGGCYRFAYQTPGEPVMCVHGVFSTIDPPTRIVFSWNIEPPDAHAGIRSEVRVVITEIPTGCELVIQHVKLSQDGAPKRHAEGWAGALDRLNEMLARQSAEGA